MTTPYWTVKSTATSWLAAATVLAVVTACTDVNRSASGPRNEVPSLIVSAPFAAAASARNSVVGSLTYVSLPPGTVPTGVIAAIRNGSSGTPDTAKMIDGGFDPVAIPASVGDTIFIQITRTGGSDPLVAYGVVGVNRAPTVVRTSPPKGKSDVPINLQIILIFSAPMDTATVNSGTVQLTLGSTSVPGTVVPGDSIGLRFYFEPTGTLAPNSNYVLGIASTITDAGGRALNPAPLSVNFTTGSGTGLFTIGGTISGLTGTGLQIVFDVISPAQEVEQEMTPTSNGAFTLSGGFPSGATYTIPWLIQPSSPQQWCTVAPSSGTIELSSLVVTVACANVGPPDPATSPVIANPPRLFADGVTASSIGGDLLDAQGHGVNGATVTMTATKGTLSPIVIQNEFFNAQLTSTTSDDSSIVLVKVNGQPFGAPVIVKFATHDVWVYKPNGLDAQDFGMQAINGIVYTVGGIYHNGLDNTSAAMTAFNSATEDWTGTTPAAMSVPRSALATAVVNGKLYAMGGLGTPPGLADPTLAAVEVYDPTTNVWDTKSPMPGARAELGADTVNGIIYAVGGRSANNIIYNTVQAYDQSTDTWSTVASMPTPRAGLGVVSVNGLLYAIGGHDASGTASPMSTVEAYNPSTGSWATRASMPHAASNFAIAAVNGKIYVIANSIQIYDPATDRWSAGTSSSTDRVGGAGAAAGGRIFVTGGTLTFDDYGQDFEIYVP